MKKYLVLFTCEENGKNHRDWIALSQTEKERRIQEGAAAQDQWTRQFGKSVVFDGGSLQNRTLQIDTLGSKDVPARVGHFLVVQAPSQDMILEMFKSHPHFFYFPGDGVEITECGERN